MGTEDKKFPGLPLSEIRRPGVGVYLTRFTVGDAQEIFDLINASRDHLSQLGDGTAAKYPDVASVLESITHPKNPDKLRFAIRREDGVMVGSINLTPDIKNPARAEIGYYLGFQHTRQGHMLEAVKLLTDCAFDQLDYREVYGVVNSKNLVSSRVLRRAGYVRTNANRLHWTWVRLAEWQDISRESSFEMLVNFVTSQFFREEQVDRFLSQNSKKCVIPYMAKEDFANCRFTDLKALWERKVVQKEIEKRWDYERGDVWSSQRSADTAVRETIGHSLCLILEKMDLFLHRNRLDFFPAESTQSIEVMQPLLRVLIVYFSTALPNPKD